MVKSKYTFEKRQREIARHKKQEEKAARRAEAKKDHAQAPEGVAEEESISPSVEAEPRAES